MTRTTLAALAAALFAAPVNACTPPKKPMPFPLYSRDGTVLIQEGECIIDPEFYFYQPPPHEATYMNPHVLL
jgi:hypothetical protein